MVEQFENYFGLSDATYESKENILPDHVSFTFEGNLKFGDRSEGKQVIVGIKGSGKTALRRYVEHTEDAIIWNIDCDHTYLDIDAPLLKARSGVTKNSLSLELLRMFSLFLLEETSEHDFSGKAKSALRSAYDRVCQILNNVPGAITINAQVVQVQVDKLLKPKALRFVKSAWQEIQPSLLDALGDKRAYIMIDDAEDVFPGLEENPLFIEGLARAVHDINITFGDRLHVLLFLKYGIWRQWFENQKEYDKVKGVVQQISWDYDSLCEVIARRIARIHGVELGPTELELETTQIKSLWGLEFDWKRKSFDRFTREITQYCVSGPRDMIVLANEAKQISRERKITISKFRKVLPKYSESKVYEINADFGDVYPEIHRFVERVFQGCPSEMSGKEAADWIEKEAFTCARVDDQFMKYEWYSTSSKEKLTSLMYEVGLLGRKESGTAAIYSMQKPTETARDLLEGRLVVHPAFRPHLAVTKPLEKTSKKGRSSKE